MRSKLVEKLLAEVPPEVKERVRKQLAWLATAEPCGDDEPGAALYYCPFSGERMMTAVRWPTYEDAIAYLKSSGWPAMRYIDPGGYRVEWAKQDKVNP